MVRRPSLTAALLALALAPLAPGCDADGTCLDDAGRPCELGLPAVDEVTVPAGPFTIGCNPALDADCTAAEGPQVAVDVAEFHIDRREVTVSEFAAFMTQAREDGDQPPACTTDTPCIKVSTTDIPVAQDATAGDWAPLSGLDARPMTHVTWFGARAYCEWTQRRLCTEAEWEKAARGGCELYGDCAAETRTFPWGEEAPTCAEATHQPIGEGPGCGTGTVEDVGGRPAGASPYGAEDMAGNVWEWVEDGLATGAVGHEGRPTDGSAWGTDSPFRLLKGGGGLGGPGDQRAAARGDGAPGDVSVWRGFRCCR